jgi:hypothetical protein
MEVHHHAHHSTSPGQRKKWTHYVWEFLMLFLAVFCGFIAENTREHIVEHKKAKAYARSLLKDLQNDTADIVKAERFENRTVAMIDSLISLTNDQSIVNKWGHVYYYLRFALWQYSIDWNKATLNQPISSGNLRYFTNYDLVNLISEYNTNSNTITDREQGIEANRMRAIALRDQILNVSISKQFFVLTMGDLLQGKHSATIDSLKNQDLPVQDKDPKLLNNLMNALLATEISRQTLKRNLYPLATKIANEIMELLQKEYHLE